MVHAEEKFDQQHTHSQNASNNIREFRHTSSFGARTYYIVYSGELEGVYSCCTCDRTVELQLISSLHNHLYACQVSIFQVV